MRSLGKILLISGPILVVAIFGFGDLLWNEPSSAGESQAAGMFVFIVFGLPAVGFLIFTTIVGRLMFAFGSKARTPEPRQGWQIQNSAPSENRTMSGVGFWVAFLWTAPCGFIASIGLITGEWIQLFYSLLAWVLIAGPAFLVHIKFRPTK